MKNFILGLIGVLVTVVLSVVCTLAIENYVLPIQTDEARVMEIANTAINNVQNPQFETTDAAMTYYEKLVDSEITDSFLVSIPRETYERITTVLIGRNKHCDRKDILVEYLKNYNPVYQYLESDNPEPPSEKQLDENTKAVRVDPDTTSSNDTVINGQLYKILKE